MQGEPRISTRENSGQSQNADALIREILARTRSTQFLTYVKELLVELCQIDTTPNAVVDKMRAAEEGCFKIIERELGALGLAGARLQRRSINPAIQSHRNYSQPYFTKTAARPQGLSPEEVYSNRANLVFLLPGAGEKNAGQSLALNAHIDVVAPYFPPVFKNGVVHGRGACDDKGPVVGIIAALRVLSEVMAKAGLKCNRNLLAMFVVEEETGGNGSLSLALDRELKRHYDTLLVSECTGLKIHPANRGAVWYKAELSAPLGVSNFEMFAFVNEEMEKEGAAIRAESRHALFPQRPYKTCHGMIGPFGEHPSRICGEVSFCIQFERQPDQKRQALVQDCLEAGLAGYIGFYGDKTQVLDPSTGKPMVPRHYDLRQTAKGFEVDVHGATGHMGAIRERDGAITKMAHLVRSLIASKAKLEVFGGPVRFELAGVESCAAKTLVLEGGQGFVPTHRIEEVMERMRNAAQRAAQNYLRRVDRSAPDAVKVSYEKLHNLAFDGDPNSPSMQNAIAAAKASGMWKDEPVLGWTVSCDSRLASEYPEMPVLTFGPGQLSVAHSDQEQIDLEEIRIAAEFLAIFILKQTGTLD